MKYIVTFLVALLVAFSGYLGPGFAQSGQEPFAGSFDRAQSDQQPSSVVTTNYSKTTIFTEHDAITPGGEIWLAFHQEISEGWHVFWVNPGDAGLPLALTWQLPPGIEAGEIIHPVPHKIPVGPLASYAHEGAPVFLVPLRATDALQLGETLKISVNGFWQVCEEICVPEGTQISSQTCQNPLTLSLIHI